MLCLFILRIPELLPTIDFVLFCFVFAFLGPHSQPVEVPRLWVESELQLLAYTTAHSNVGSPTQWVRPGIKHASSWILIGFISTEPKWELHFFFLNKLYFLKQFKFHSKIEQKVQRCPLSIPHGPTLHFLSLIISTAWREVSAKPEAKHPNSESWILSTLQQIHFLKHSLCCGSLGLQAHSKQSSFRGDYGHYSLLKTSLRES